MNNNSSLFRLRNDTGKLRNIYLLSLLLMLLVAVTIVSVSFKDKGFLTYHSKTEYQPLNVEDSVGFYGKINYYLRKALADTIQEKYTFDKIDSFYPRLSFFYPSDSLSYLFRNNELRLIGYKPDSKNLEDQRFFYNSDFKKILQKQSLPQYLTEQYFVIEFDKSTPQPRIKSIKIDTTRLKMNLSYDYWQGKIALTDPYHELDKRLLYLEGPGGTIPIFSSTGIRPEDFKNGEPQWDTISYPLTREVNIEKFYKSSYGKVLSITYQNNNNSLRILNDSSGIYIQNNNQFHYNIMVNDTGVIKPGQTIKLSGKIAAQGVRLSLEKGVQVIYQFFLSGASPYDRASIPVTGSLKGSRFRIGGKNIDQALQQQLTVLEGVMDNRDSLKQVNLSTNPALSVFLESEIMNYVRALKSTSSIAKDKDDIVEMSMCVMDSKTGEILAAPFYGNYFKINNVNETTDRRNFNLELHDIGSTFKPLLYLAAAVKYPEIKNFELNNSETSAPNPTKVIGYHTEKFGYHGDIRAKLFWEYMPIKRSEAIAKSHDTYPVAVTLLALTEKNDPAAYIFKKGSFNNTGANFLFGSNRRSNTARITIAKDSLTYLKDLPQSSFFKLLHYLYDVQIEKNGTENIYDNSTFYLNERKKVAVLCPEVTSFFDSSFQGTQNYSLVKLKVDMLGQGNNRWSNVKLAESYARAATGRKVQASFLKKTPTTISPSLFEPTIKQIYNGLFTDKQEMIGAWEDFRKDWSDAVMNQTQTLLSTATNRFNLVLKQVTKEYGLPENLRFFCKTGTPQETPARRFDFQNKNLYIDEGLFAFSLITPGDTAKGITAVIYIKHLSEQPIVIENGVAKGVESITARDFLTPERIKYILFYCKSRFQ